MSELNELFLQLMNELKEIKSTMATKEDIRNLSEKLDSYQVENLNADNLLMSQIRSIREGVVFVNRKVADAELELNIMKQTSKQQ
ncbi:hypothetical protein ACQYAD_09415 [Neobacillus sp. SM06]|uniref:hypothetical protein n=1 Tax=Neobacillus sp. SM06 TaxID=3422492 RepID=UPI003D2BD111